MCGPLTPCACRPASRPARSASDAGSDTDTAAPDGRGREAPRRKALTRHPDFPDLPVSVPLTYTLAMKACLSRDPAERPTFPQLQVIIADLEDEVARGHYINGNGRAQVRLLLSDPAACGLLRAGSLPLFGGHPAC